MAWLVATAWASWVRSTVHGIVILNFGVVTHLSAATGTVGTYANLFQSRWLFQIDGNI